MYDMAVNIKASMNADVPFKSGQLHIPCVQSQVLSMHMTRKGPVNNALVTLVHCTHATM